jgi:hypothetical protein
MDPLDQIIELFGIWGNNFKNNLTGMWTGMDTTRWIRLIAVVGFYLLFRDYVVKFAEKKQAKEHKKAMESTEAKISANALRGASGKKVSFEESGDETEEAAKASGPDWGKKARKRQKQVVKKLQEAQEDRLREEQEDEEVKDIMDLLVDYEEGKDGW